jgi:large repetitive protein
MERLDPEQPIFQSTDILSKEAQSSFADPSVIGSPNPNPTGQSSLPEIGPELVPIDASHLLSSSTLFESSPFSAQPSLQESGRHLATPGIDPLTGLSLTPSPSLSDDLSILQSPSLGNISTDDVLLSAQTSAQATLQNFFSQPDWQQTFEDIFGKDLNPGRAQELATAFTQGNFSALPPIEILPESILNGGRGGFDTQAGKIYLSDTLFNADPSNTTLVKSVLLEEIGHYLDAQVNQTDTLGDEGEYFADRLQGIDLSNVDLQRIKTEDDKTTIWLNGTQHLIEQATTLPNFTIRTQGNLRMNGGGDLDGDPLNLQDDALVYAAKGFIINGNATLPVQYNANGTVLRDASGKAILVPNALTVATGYTSSNGPSNSYAGVNPPTVISPQTIDIPLYGDLLNQTLSAKVPSGTPEVIFNAQTPLNTVSDWNTKFPSGGTTTNPKVVRVANGSLNIPSNAVLGNTIIKVDSGSINFNGGGQTFTNVVLITTNGNINLNNANATDLSVFASGSINANGSAKIGGTSLFATASTSGNVTFNGSTKTVTGTDQLQVISQGNITYNGSSDTRGSFLSAGTFTFNGSSSLYGSIGAKGDITFNGKTTVIGASIRPFNQAPSDLNLSPTSIAENVANSSVVGTLSTTDPNPGNTFTYSLVSGVGSTDNAAFSIAGNQLKINASPDFEAKSSYSVRVRTTDQGGLSYDQVFTVSITNVNEAPTQLQLTGNTIAENSIPGTVIGHLSTQDPDAGDTFTYALLDDAGGRFQVVGTQVQVKNGALLDFEQATSHSITVQTTDAGGLSTTQQFAIALTNLNEAPTDLSLSPSSTLENVAVESTIGSFSTTDPDLGNTFTYSLVNGIGSTDNAAFSVVGNQLTLNASPDFEAQPSYSIRVRTTDQGGLSVEKALTVSVLNVNEAPIAITLSNASVAENSLGGTVIGQLSTTDPDLGDTHQYTLTDTAGDRFEIIGNTLYVKAGAVLDFESTPQLSIEVQSTDAGGLSTSQRFAISLSDVNEAPTLSPLADLSVEEGSLVSFSPIATDPDQPSQPLTYSLESTPVPGVNLDPSTGVFTWTPTENQGPGSYSFAIKVSDGALSNSKTFSIYVNEVNVAPVLEGIADQQLQLGNTLTLQTSATDADLPANALTYSLDADAPTGAVIDPVTGLLSWTPITAGDFQLTVRVSDNGTPSLWDAKTIRVQVLSSNQAPTALALNPATIPENSPANSTIGTLSTTDPDIGNTFTYSLIPGSGSIDNGAFTIIGNQLKINASPDYEAKSSYSIRVKTTDQGGLSVERVLSVAVTNVNEAPIFTSTLTGTATADVPYEYRITTADPENDTRAITAAQLPAWMTLQDNGDGTATLSGTPSFADTGFFTVHLAVTETATTEHLQGLQTAFVGVDALLQEQSNFAPERTIAFTIPTNPAVLSFKINPLTFDLTDSTSINDAFEVALVDAQGKSLLPTLGTGRDSFFNWTEGFNAASSAGTTYDAATGIVTVNLTGIKPGTDAQLVFRLVNDDADTTTQVRITDLSLTDAPVGTVVPVVTGTGVAVGLTGGIVEFNHLQDVTPSVAAQYGRSSFNDQTNLLYADVALRNSGTYAMDTPLIVAVNHISDPSVQLRDPDGFTPEGFPYYDFSALVADGKLEQGEVSNARSLVFYNPNEVQFTYDLVVLAAVNQAPVIQTQPNLEVIGGQPYRYDVNATDPEQDALTYKLVQAPAGMSIDSQTGLISWDTQNSDIGNYSVKVEVSDGRGGVSQQTYTLAVTDAPPNRPPIFTSIPEVDAFINKLYKYDANAIDPDQDNPLSFSLVIGPNGAKVNSTTGVLEWTPPPALILGDTVLGRIGIPGENDEFTFSGMKGQQIYFDPLQYSGDYTKWHFDVYSPSGRKVIDGASLRWDDNRLLTLDEDGNYKIVIDALGDHTGSYGFSVIDLGLVPEVPFDTVVKGSLSPGSEDDVYRFSGRQGQKLYFDRQNKGGSMDWVIYNSGNQVVASNYNFDDMEVDLPADGNYILSLRGSSGFASTVDYSFSIVTPDLTTAPLPLNQVVSGSIAEKGEQDSYTFSGTVGQQLFFDSLGGNYLPISVYDPTGRRIFSGDNRNDHSPSEGLILSMDGLYKVVVDGEGEGTGNYSFRFLDRAAATDIPLDTDITGTFDNGGLGSAAYRFTLNETKYLFFDGQGGNGAWILYGANGQYIASQYMSYNNELSLGAGDYFLVAQGYGGGDVNYKLQLVTPEFSTAAMAIGTEVSGVIGEKGERDSYTFTGTAGQQLFFDSLSNSLSWYYSFNVIVYDPSGRQIFNRDSRSDAGPDSGLTLSTNGAYRVVIDGNDESTGNYKFRFLDRAAATDISPDTDITGSFDNGGLGSVGYRFSLDSAKYIFFDGQGGTGAWVLYGGNGQYVTSQDMRYNNEFWLGAGDYFLVAQGYGGGDINYTLRLVTPEFSTATMTLGTEVSGVIAEKGQKDSYTFTGIAGQQLFFDSLSGNSLLNIIVYDPSGRQIFNQGSQGDAGPSPGLTLSTNGAYRVVIDGNDESTGNYKFRFLDRAAATEVILDTDIIGTFDNGGLGSVGYRFKLNESHTLLLDGQDGNGAWILYGVNGYAIASQLLRNDQEFTVAAGDYFLVAQGYASNDLNYKLRIVDKGVVASTPSSGTAMALGSVLSGSIATPGVQDSYTFTGTAGQQLFYDSLGGDYYIQIRVYDPSGREVFRTNSPYDQGPESGLTLSVNGTYQVVVTGDYGYYQYTGNYKFRFLDRATAVEVTLDTDITGTFDNDGFGSTAYHFTLSDSRYLYVDGQSGGGNWIIYGPNGQLVTSQNISSDREFWLGAGNYYLVAQGYGSGDPNYKLRIVTPELNSAPMTIGTTISGAITEKGEQDTYTFTGTAGQQLFYDAMGGEYYNYVSVYDPSGRQVASINSPYDQGPDAGLTLSMNGTYRVVVDGQGETLGNYKFRFLDRATAVEVVLDTDITGTFDNDGFGSTAYHFTLSDNRYLYVDGQSGGGNWIIYGPNGQLVTYQNIASDREFWLGAGDYYLVAQGNGYGGLNYKLRIVTPELNSAPMTIGTTISGSITEKGEQDTYTFTGAAGQQLFYDAMGGEYYNYVSIYDPNGRQVFNTNSFSDQGPNTGLILSMNGHYRVVVDGQGETLGDYRFRFLDRATAVEVTLDTDIIGTFDNSGLGSAIYHFTLTESRYLYVDGQTGNGYWDIYGPNGQRVTYQTITNDQEFWLGSGDYFLVAEGNGYGDPNYKLRIVTPELISTPMTLDTTISGLISEKGEWDTYTFTGTVGQQLFYDALASDSNLTVYLYSPTGRQVRSHDIRSDVGPNDGFTLNETGTYRLVVDGNGENTGSYSFRLLDKAKATALVFNTDVAGTFDNGGLESDTYRFTGNEGQYFYLDTGAGQYNNAWILYGPGGQLVRNGYVQDGYFDDSEFALPASGEYMLVMQGNGAANQNYSVHLANPELITRPLTLGAAISGTLDKRGEQDTYTFDGTVGQQLFLDALGGNSSLKARLYAPSGVLVADKDTASDWGAFNLTETGTYRLVVDGDRTTTGSYSFSLIDRASAPALTFGLPVTGRLDVGNSMKLYRFTGRTGQQLSFDLDATAWNGANWVLYDPSGKAMKAPAANSPDFAATLGVNGVYTLAIVGNGSNPVDYGFAINDVSVSPVRNSGLGVVQSGYVNAGQTVDYTFTATAGTLIRVDGQTPDYYYGWQIRTRLLNPDGKPVYSDLDSRSNSGPILLEQSGNYKLQVIGYYGSGSYQFNVQELPNNFRSPTFNYLEIGSAVSGTLNTLQDKVYTFQGAVGQKLLFNAMSGQNVQATLYDSSGNAIITVNDLQWNNDSGAVTLTQDGFYYLVIQNNEYSGRDYTFQLSDLTIAPEVNYGLSKVGSVENSQENQFFKLHANAGEKLYFDSITSTTPGGDYWNYHWKLIGPGNTVLFDTYQIYDAEVIAPTTGDYYLEIQGGYSIGRTDYNFRVLNPQDRKGDIITPGSGEQSANSADSLGLFPVKIEVKDTRGATAIQDFNIRLWPDPENGNPVIISTPQTRFSLADRVYRYQLKSVDPDGDPLTYRLLDAPLGALIDSVSGELLWFPESQYTPGATVNFQVEVSDKRGGKDIQTFIVDVYGNLGKIQGAVFDDLNLNGFRDTKLVSGANPAIIFAIDISGSTIAPFFGEEGDKSTRTVLEAEVAAALTMIDTVVAQGAGDRVKFGIIPFSSTSTIQDMDLVTPGLQVYTTANSDANNNGIADIREILQSYRPTDSSNLTGALSSIDTLVDILPGDPNFILMSDGYAKLDEAFAAQTMAEIQQKGANLTAFGVGIYSTIETIRKIDPTAERITDFDKLIDIFSGFDDRYAIEPLKENVTVYLDLNNNGVLDVGEPNQLTKKSTDPSTVVTNRYYYTFDNLIPGNYTVRTLVPNGYIATTPLTNAYTDTVTLNGENYVHLFGVGKISEPPNQDPTFVTTAPALTQLKAGQPLLYQATARDSDGDAVSYSLVFAPDGMTVDAKSGEVVWIPTQPQVTKYYQELKAEQDRLTAIGRGDFAPKIVEFNVLVRAQDPRGGQALQYIKVQLLPDNNAPIFTSTPSNTTPQIGKPFQYQAKAQDANGDTLTYALQSGAPSGLSINASTGLVSWTPTAAQLGTQSFTIRVTDGKGGEDRQTVNLSVVQATANHAPVFTSTPRTTTRLGNTYLYDVAASDTDGDALTYTLQFAPTGMTLTNGVVSWVPTAAQSGDHMIALQVSDGTLTTTQTYTLTVANQAPNHAPTITSAPTLVTNLDRPYIYNLSGSDSDGDLVVWSLENAPTGMVLDAETGALRWQPKSNQLGNHTVTVKLADSYGAFSTQVFTLKVTGTNTPATVASTPITKAAVNQAYGYQVAATDPENDALRYSLGKRPQGMTVDLTGKISWIPQSNQVGTHQVEVLVTDSQGATTTQTYTLEVGTTPINHAPEITSTPGLLADINTGYRYQVQASDPDHNPLTYQLISGPQGMSVDPLTGLTQWQNPVTGTYQVVVGALDNQGLGAAQSFTLTAKANGLPTIQSTPAITATPGVEYQYDLQATDPEGDALTYALDPASAALGMTLDNLGRLRWTPTAAQLGTKSVTLTVKDSAGATVTQQFNLAVTADTEAPKINLIRSVNIADPGEEVFFQALATDNVGIKNLQLLINNTPVAIDGNGVARLTNVQPGTITAKAIATDLAGNQSETTTTIQVRNPADTDAPQIDLDLSGITNGTITGPVQIKGSVTDTNLDYYVLEVAPLDGSTPFKEVFRGTTNITNSTLGTFDPSLLLNDTYILRLSAFDTNGQGTTTEQTLSVAGELKLGNFRLSFTDLTIPVTGIPITLTRTYDTLTSNTRDDFGYGWRMEFRDTDLRTNLGKDEQYELFGIPSKGFKEGTRVYITLPGGKREGFTFKPTIDPISRFFPSVPGGDPTLYRPAFVADKGSTSTLSVQNVRMLRTAEGTFAGLSGYFYNPADAIYGSIYTLTTKEGIEYEIDGQTGDLLKVTDTDGNTLTFTDFDVTSSTGQKIVFERDSEGKITSVTDPMGQKVKYVYNDKGDLIGVTDREGNTTQFEYSTAQAHYLDKIIDPLGRTGIKNEYDDKGRLKRILDTNGNPVEMIYDPNNSIQKVKDALGNETVYEYDNQGNVVTEIDAEGKITKRAYDGNNNVLKEIVISDRSGPDGFTTEYTYDSNNNMLSMKDALGNTTYYTYGAKSRQLSQTDALGRTTLSAYNKRGDLTTSTDALGNTTSYGFGFRGTLYNVTDALGQTMNFGYDNRGNVTSVTDALGHITQYTYNANGDKLSETRTMTTSTGVKTLITNWTYDSNGRMLTMTDAEGNFSRYEYNSLGQQVTSIDALGRKTLYRYDEKGQQIEVIYPDDTPSTLDDNLRTQTRYDILGRTTATIDMGGRETRYIYDKVGRVIATLLPDTTPTIWDDNPRTQTQYYDDGLIKAQIDELGHRTEYRYDANGRQIEVIYADDTPNDLSDNSRTRYQYDAAGQQTAVMDALGRVTTSAYDSAGRLVRMTYADGTFTTTEYDQLGRRTASIDQNGKRTEYRYDALGRLTGVKDALNQWTEYGYNEIGNLIAQTDAESNTTQYEYDTLRRRIAVILPMGQRSTMTYDAVSNLKTTTDFNGKTTTYSYDPLNRLTTKQFQDGSAWTFTYTPTGQQDIVMLLDSNQQIVDRYDYDYNERDWLIGRTDALRGATTQTIGYGYDVAGNKTSMTTPSGTVNYSYDSRNRLDKVIQNGITLADYDYNAVNNLVQTTFSNGTQENRQYDLLNRLVYLENRKDSTILSSYAYTLDKVGNRTQITEQDGRTSSYRYDDLDRLSQEKIVDPVNGNRTTDFVYDKVGNRLGQTETINGTTKTTAYFYDANDRLLSETSGGQVTTYSYDNNGNTTRKQDGDRVTAYTWNDEGRLVGATVQDANGNPIQQMEYRYNANGIRVMASTDGQQTFYLLDEVQAYAQVTEEYDGAGAVQVSYGYGNDLINQTRNSQTTFYLVDGLGSTRLLTDELGNVVNVYDYEAFGETINQSGTVQNGYLFAGEQFDRGLGDYYLRDRFYDAGTGRFTRQDTYEGNLSNPLTLHNFVYTHNNPVNGIDPSGFMTLGQLTAGLVILGILSSLTVGFNVFDGPEQFDPTWGFGPRGLGGGSRVVEQIPYKPNSFKMVDEAAVYRSINKVPFNRNIAVVAYKDLNTSKIKLVSVENLPTKKGFGRHSEHMIADALSKLRIPTKNVLAIYSELEPCNSGQHNCAQLLRDLYPRADVYWSFTYNGGINSERYNLGQQEKRNAFEMFGIDEINLDLTF